MGFSLKDIVPSFSLVADGGEWLSDIGGKITGADAQKKANQANIDQTNEARAWAEQMSNTAYQRSRADMAKAGLNPILTAYNGGASTPNVPAPYIESTGKQNASLASSAFSIASGVPSMLQNIATARAQEKLNSANAVKASMDAQATSLQNQVLQAKMPSVKAQAAIDTYKATERQKSSSWELMMEDIKRGFDALNPFSGATSTKDYNSNSIKF